MLAFLLSKSKDYCEIRLTASNFFVAVHQGLQLVFLRARLYSSRRQAVAWKDVVTQVSKRRMVRGPGSRTARRYPWVEALFEDRFIQPFIHDAHITLIKLRTFLPKSCTSPS